MENHKDNRRTEIDNDEYLFSFVRKFFYLVNICEFFRQDFFGCNREVIDNLSNFLLSFGEYFDDVHFSVSFHVVDSAPMRINKC